MSNGRDAAPYQDLDLDLRGIITMNDVDPKKARYDETKTIDYELNSLHTPTNLRHTLPHIFQLSRT